MTAGKIETRVKKVKVAMLAENENHVKSQYQQPKL